MSANIFRKPHLTSTKEQQGDEVMYVNSLLCHSSLAGGKHYMSTKHEKNAIRGTKVSGEVFHLTLEVECEKKTKKNKQTDELENIFMQTWRCRKCQWQMRILKAFNSENLRVTTKTK